MDSDIWSESITIKKDRIIFLSVNKAGEMMHFEAKVSGGQNVQNLLGAILVAKELGMTFDEISEACKNITPEQAGITLIKGKHGLEIIDSSYSSNPDGVFADLDYFSIFENKKVIVMPCLIELGEKSSQIHEKIGRKIGEVCDLLIVTSKDKFAEFKKGAMASGMTEKNILLCDKAQDIYSAVTLFCTAEDAVLLEGRVPSELIKLLSE
jgi:UDP-N-acetylmuramoyl-tripeptide--D-alanyl-D-alanine ligase